MKFWAVNGADVTRQLGPRQPRAGSVGGHQQQRLPHRGQPHRGQRRRRALLRDQLQRRHPEQHDPAATPGSRAAARSEGRHLPRRDDLPVRVRWRTPRAGPHRQDRDLPERAREQLGRDHRVGERRPVLQQPGQHLHRRLHAARRADQHLTVLAPAIAGEPLYADCRWKTQRVDIHDNTFAFDPVPSRAAAQRSTAGTWRCWPTTAPTRTGPRTRAT